MSHDNAQRKIGGFIEPVLLIRLIVSAVLIAIAAMAKLPNFLSIILFLLAAAAAGYDIALSAVEAVQKKDYFAAPVILFFVAVIAFVIGFGGDAAAMLFFYQAGLLATEYLSKRMRASALCLAGDPEGESLKRLSELADDKDATGLSSAEEIAGGAAFALRLAIAAAVLYALLVPVFTNCGYRISIHRALMAIVAATPMSLFISIPFSGLMGLCFSDGNGIVCSRADTLGELQKVSVAVFDKTGVFTDEEPKVLSANSSVLSRQTFLTFAAHAVYYSGQSFAKAVSALYDKDYRLDVIADFVDIPGSGVDVTIGGAHVTLAKRELFAGRGVSVPVDVADGNQVYYMTVADRYVGKLCLADVLNAEAETLPEECKNLGIERCILLTEDSREESKAFAKELGFDGILSQCDVEKKLAGIEEIKNKASGPVMYVYSQGIEAHSAADIDVRVSKKGKFADIILNPEYIFNLPFAIQISCRMNEVAKQGVFIAFAVKALLIFLSLSGFCSIWFSMFLDMAAALSAILNANRVTGGSLGSILKKED